MSNFDPIDYSTGTAIRDYDIIKITPVMDGYEVLMDINLDSGYSLTGTKMQISNEDMMAYETSDIEEGIKYALGFFNENEE